MHISMCMCIYSITKMSKPQNVANTCCPYHYTPAYSIPSASEPFSILPSQPLWLTLSHSGLSTAGTMTLHSGWPCNMHFILLFEYISYCIDI